MLENLEVLKTNEVIPKMFEMKNGKYRFVTITACANDDETIDLFYSFDKDYQLITIKTTFPKDEPVKSISSIYLAAAFAENEIKELFGVRFEELVLDYGGHLMLAKGAPESPFGSGVIIERKGGK